MAEKKELLDVTIERERQPVIYTVSTENKINAPAYTI